MSPSVTSPRAVLFDFSGTLFDDTSAVPVDLLVECAARHSRRLGPDEAGRLRAKVLRRADSPAGAVVRRQADLSPSRHRAAWRSVAALEPGIDDVLADAFYDCVTAAGGWHPYPDVGPVLRALRARDIRIGVVSNTGWDIRGSFRLAGLLDVVDDVVLSCEVGIEKPSPEIFRLACRRLGIRPEEACS